MGIPLEDPNIPERREIALSLSTGIPNEIQLQFPGTREFEILIHRRTSTLYAPIVLHTSCRASFQIQQSMAGGVFEVANLHITSLFNTRTGTYLRFSKFPRNTDVDCDSILRCLLYTSKLDLSTTPALSTFFSSCNLKAFPIH